MGCWGVGWSLCLSEVSMGGEAENVGSEWEGNNLVFGFMTEKIGYSRCEIPQFWKIKSKFFENLVRISKH